MKQLDAGKTAFLKFFLPYVIMFIFFFCIQLIALFWGASSALQTRFYGAVIFSALFLVAGLVLSAMHARRKSRSYVKLLEELDLPVETNLRADEYSRLLDCVRQLQQDDCELSAVQSFAEQETMKRAAENGWYYPAELENALLECVFEADYERAKEVLQYIKEENFVNRNISARQACELVDALRVSIQKISELKPESVEFESQNLSVYHFFEDVSRFFYELCVKRQTEPQTRGNKICSDVQQYITQHYHDENLSLYFLADLYQLNPSYLSSLFKRNVGCGLSSYLESVRVTKAADYIEQGEYSIGKIAELVGFGNSLRFRRSFKKLKGVNPSDYMKA